MAAVVRHSDETMRSAWAQESCEFTLACDGEGRITWTDPTARARTGATEGMLLFDLGPEGVRIAQTHRPNVILLDFLLREMNAFDVLDELQGDARTRSIPVIIVTSHSLQPEDRQRLATETEVILSKQSLSREIAINRIRDALSKAGVGAASRATEA